MGELILRWPVLGLWYQMLILWQNDLGSNKIIMSSLVAGWLCWQLNKCLLFKVWFNSDLRELWSSVPLSYLFWNLVRFGEWSDNTHWLQNANCKIFLLPFSWNVNRIPKNTLLFSGEKFCYWATLPCYTVIFVLQVLLTKFPFVQW